MSDSNENPRENEQDPTEIIEPVGAPVERDPTRATPSRKAGPDTPYPRVTGTVCNTDGEPILGARVTFRDTEQKLVAQAATDAEGKFQIEKLNEDLYLMGTSADGHISRSRNFTLQRGEDPKLDLMLEPAGSRTPLLVAIIAAIVFAALAIVAAIALFGADDETDEVEPPAEEEVVEEADISVPDVTGLTFNEAREALNNAGLRLGSVTNEPSDTADPGIIVRQEPSSGVLVTENAAVNVFVAVTDNEAAVPNLRGLTLDEATEALERVGLAVGEITDVPIDNVQHGLVIDANPAPNTIVETGTAVNLTFAVAPDEVEEDETVELISLVGRTEADAVRWLDDNDILVIIERQFSDEPAGVVIGQDPDVDTLLDPDDEVLLTVSRGPDPDGDDPDPEPEPDPNDNGDDEQP